MPRDERSFDAVVVGAGMAGIACATRLCELGLRVCLAESRSVLGGRASSWTDPRLGVEVDNGPHLFAGAYREVAALLERVGSARTLGEFDSLRVPLVAGNGQRGVLAWKAGSRGLLGLAQGFAGFAPLSLGERGRLAAVLVDAWAARVPESWTLGQWLDGLGQSPAARRWIWHPLARAVFNEEPERVSAHLFAEVARRLFLGAPGDGALVHARVGLSRVYAEPGASYLESRGSHVLPGSPVRTVRPGLRGFDVEFEDRPTLTAAAVCLAVPARRAASVLDASLGSRLPALARVASAPHAPLVSVNLWLEGDEPAGDEPFFGLVESEFAWVFDRTALVAPGGPGRHVVLVAPGARHLMTLPAHRLVRQARRALAEHFPQTSGRALSAARVIKQPEAALSLTPEVARARPPQETPVAGLVLAGDWTETGLPATLEGAAWSGHAAAVLLARHLAGSLPRREASVLA